jgi:hypothetical protein
MVLMCKTSEQLYVFFYSFPSAGLLVLSSVDQIPSFIVDVGSYKCYIIDRSTLFPCILNVYLNICLTYKNKIHLFHNTLILSRAIIIRIFPLSYAHRLPSSGTNSSIQWKNSAFALLNLTFFPLRKIILLRIKFTK